MRDVPRCKYEAVLLAIGHLQRERKAAACQTASFLKWRQLLGTMPGDGELRTLPLGIVGQPVYGWDHHDLVVFPGAQPLHHPGFSVDALDGNRRARWALRGHEQPALTVNLARLKLDLHGWKYPTATRSLQALSQTSGIMNYEL